MQSAIQWLAQKNSIDLKKIDAVAVTAGPGSYTGLRVGMASAKGLCYALKKPLIALGTLEVLTVSALDVIQQHDATVLFCPMLDARRMEVFTAIYKFDLSSLLSPCAMVLDEFSFEKELATKKICFFGNGSNKWKDVCTHSNALFEIVAILPNSLCKRSNELFLKQNFANLAYSEPFYLKEFQTVIKK